MALTQLARQAFNQGVNAVRPTNLVKGCYKIEDSILTLQSPLDGTTTAVPLQHNLTIIGFGKAVAHLANGLLTDPAIESHVQQGILSVPEGLDTSLLTAIPARVQLCPGAKHNLPDENSLATTQAIVTMAASLQASDVVLVLISGGGSALLSLPQSPISLVEYRETIRALAGAGAPIEELNAVRTCLSQVKGGKLAALCQPAQVVSLIISDVVGDPLPSIASGPTVATEVPLTDALAILSKYDVLGSVASSVRDVLQRDQLSVISALATNIIIGNNRLALLGAATSSMYRRITACVPPPHQHTLNGFGTVSKQGIPIHTPDLLLSGDVKDAAKTLMTMATEMQTRSEQGALLIGGEVTVCLQGTGVGGRNQELALLCAQWMFQHPSARRMVVLCGGTDGQDGPTAYAGACVTDCTWATAVDNNLNPEQRLGNNDSSTLLEELSSKQHDCLLQPGLTGTNVMDLYMVLW
eukprot:m.31986 g.31986  ORF g.31986 m.31986 type:complete len:468 (-) comp12115_c0_seq2:43-1446(-)